MHDQQPIKKKTWVKPELIVLVRHKPEEDVLSGCKTYTSGQAPGLAYKNCVASTGACFPCSNQFGS